MATPTRRGDTDATLLVIQTSCRPGSNRDEFRIAATVIATRDGGPSFGGLGGQWLSEPFDMSLDTRAQLASIDDVQLHIAATSAMSDPCPFVLEIGATDESGNPHRFFTFPEGPNPRIWTIVTELPSQRVTDC